MTGQLYEVVKPELKYNGTTYHRGEVLELIGTHYDSKLIGKYVRKYEKNNKKVKIVELMEDWPEEEVEEQQELLSEEAEAEKCIAITASGNRCKRDAVDDSGYCGIHRSKNKEKLAMEF